MDSKFAVSWPDSSAKNAEQYSALATVLEPHHEQFRKVQAEINRLQEQLVIIKMAAVAELSRRQTELNITPEAVQTVC